MHMIHLTNKMQCKRINKMKKIYILFVKKTMFCFNFNFIIIVNFKKKKKTIGRVADRPFW